MASIRRRGSKYQVQIRRSGTRPVSRSFLNLKDAQAWARHMEVQADRRDLPADPKVLQRITLGELVERYRDTVSVRKRTRENEQAILNAFLRHPLCRRAVSEITQADFASYRDDRLRIIRPSSLKRELVPLHNLYEISREEWGLPIRVNPLSKLKIANADQKRERRLRPHEQQVLMAEVLSCRNKLIAPLIEFALATAMRRGEILAMRWDHVDKPTRTLLIPKTKNGHSRTIPLSRDAIGIIDSLQRHHDRLFPLSGNAVNLSWQRLTRRAGLHDLHFHDLRHEAISRLFEKGLTVPEVALVSGHTRLRRLNLRSIFAYLLPIRATWAATCFWALSTAYTQSKNSNRILSDALP
jgi:integrase